MPMERVLIVGSGASAVHFALTVLQKGYRVVMLDVGRMGPEPAHPADSFAQLKRTLADPVSYFLGEQFESVRYPEDRREYYGFPPSKQHIFAALPRFLTRARGFEPLSSFARGGLAEAWTGGVYPFNDDELANFPLSYEDLAPYYKLVAQRIGISGTADDLARFTPVHESLMDPLELDEHSRVLVQTYRARKDFLNRALKCYLGRSRIATLSQDKDDRKACRYLGRCLWGCPTGSLYTPTATLRDCLTFDTFQYVSGRYVTHFRFDARRRITSVVGESVETGASEEFSLDKLVLAAGTLSSGKIFMDSIFRQRGEVVTLPGLMDNRQVLMPFVNRDMLCKPYNPDTYQYHQLCLGIEGETPQEYVHAQITTLKTALIHPIVQNVPCDLATSLYLFRHLHAALGLVNINFHDTRRSDNHLTLEVDRRDAVSRLAVEYVPSPGEASRIRRINRRVKRALRTLNCYVPPLMTHIRPMGASVHYAGTLPMSDARTTFTTSRYGQSHDFPNLFFVDGTVLPFLPAKNVTFTLMANAARVADCAF